jgi:hypothetical protein
MLAIFLHLIVGGLLRLLLAWGDALRAGLLGSPLLGLRCGIA